MSNKIKFRFAIYGFLLTINSFLVIYSYYVFNQFLNMVITNDFNSKILILFISIPFVKIILNFIMPYLKNILQYEMNHDLRFKKIHTIAINKFDENILNSSEKNKIINNINNIVEHVLFGFYNLFTILITTTLGIALLFYYHWILGLTSFLLIATSLIITILTSKSGAKYQVKIINQTNDYYGKIEKIIPQRNKYYLINKITLFNWYILRFTANKNTSIYQNFKKTILALTPASFFAYLIQVMIPITNAFLILNNQIPLSILAIGSFIAGFVSVKVNQIPFLVYNFISWNKIKKTFFKNNVNQVPFKLKEIELKNFNPTRNGEALLKNNISLKITTKSKIHISGDNGIGKTSLIKALMFNNHYQGHFWPQSALIEANNTVFLSETSYILTGTLFANMQLVNDKVSREEAKKILKRVKLNIDLDKNLSSETLSSGQKQKIALAKLLTKKPDFAFIDEGMNNIAAADRHDIQQELIKEKCAIVIISHKGVINGYQKIKII